MLELWKNLYAAAQQRNLEDVLTAIAAAAFLGTLALVWKGVPAAGRGVRAYWRWSFPRCIDCKRTVPVWFQFTYDSDVEKGPKCYSCIGHTTIAPKGVYPSPLRPWQYLVMRHRSRKMEREMNRTLGSREEVNDYANRKGKWQPRG